MCVCLSACADGDSPGLVVVVGVVAVVVGVVRKKQQGWTTTRSRTTIPTTAGSTAPGESPMLVSNTLLHDGLTDDRMAGGKVQMTEQDLKSSTTGKDDVEGEKY